MEIGIPRRPIGPQKEILSKAVFGHPNSDEAPELKSGAVIADRAP
jgi:hypothetical protein